MTETVGVLLPLQLETKFVPPAAVGHGWTMLLRVIPQPPMTDEHSEHITDEELRAASLFRRTIGRTDELAADWFGTPEHREAFAVLARSTGPARAVWLALNTLGATVDGLAAAARPSGSPTADAAAVVRGLPPTLQVGVWTYEADGSENLQVLGRLPQDGTSIAPVLPLPDLSDPGLFFDHWLVDWEQACAEGLGGTFDLATETLEGLGGVCVWGIGDQPAAHLVEHHIHAGALAEVVLGAATNSVEGEPTATSTPDEEAWWETLLRRLGPPESATTSLDRLLTRYVTGTPVSVAGARHRERLFDDLAIDASIADLFSPDDVAALVGARADIPPETALAPLLMHALWPVLWGAVARDEWRLDPASVGTLTRWALENVNPEGPLPSIRIGDQPYALLPVTRLGTWQPADGDSHLEAAGLTRLKEAVESLRRRLHATLRSGGTVRGADTRRYASLLNRGGSSRRFGARRSLPRPVLESYASWWTEPMERRQHHLDTAGLPDRLADLGIEPFVEFSEAADAIALPLVQPRRWSFWGSDMEFRRIPLPALIDLALGSGRTLFPASARLFATLGQLYDQNEWIVSPDIGMESRIGMAPDSLLARLLLQACLTANEWTGQTTLPDRPIGPDPEGHLGPGFGGDGSMIAMRQVAMLLDGWRPDSEHDWRRPDSWDRQPGSWTPSYRPEYTAPVLADGPLKRLERAFGAVLDSVSTRLDPWATAFAWQRLRAATSGPGVEHLLGAYGWVHGPFDGQPGPTPSGLLHTPSQAQTLVATMVRDDFLRNKRQGVLNERGEVPSGIALTGAATRIANELVADLRDGHHLYEILGREVERIVTSGSVSAYDDAVALRMRYRMYPDRPDPRQVCNGYAALEGLLRPGPGDVPPVVLGEGQKRALEQLRSGLDALADLTLLDGVLNSSSRQPARAAAAMNGASGSGAMPEPEYPRTPASGRELRSVLLSVLPWREPADGDGAARLAEPSVAALLETQLGTAWSWQVRFEDGRDEAVTLADLGLAPIETLAFTAGQLRTLAATAAGVVGGAVVDGAAEGTETFQVGITEDENRTWDVLVRGSSLGHVTLAGAGLGAREASELTLARLRRTVLRAHFGGRFPATADIQPVPSQSQRVWTVRDQLGNVLTVCDADTLGLTPPEAELSLAELAPLIRRRTGHPGALVTDPPELARVERLCALLGGPATERDLARDDAQLATPSGHRELLDRYAAVHADLDSTITALRAAARLGSTDPDRILAIRRGVAWGVTPDTDPADASALAAALTATTPPEGATRLRRLAGTLATELARRFKAAATPSALESRTEAEGVESLARELSALAAPQAKLPILVAWERDALDAATSLSPAAADVLEEDWLTLLAPVRPALARVEACQLDAAARGGKALSMWACDDDPWRVKAIRGIVEEAQPQTPFGFTIKPFVAAVGPDGALAASKVAVGVVDAWTEVLPLGERDTHAAFGFNAPLNRAPQAILLAVPPNAGEPLTDDDVAAMLVELRELMVARSATMPGLFAEAGLMRTTWLPEDEPVSLLDPDAYLN